MTNMKMEMRYSWNGQWDDIEIMKIPVSVEDESVDDEYITQFYINTFKTCMKLAKNGIT